MPCMGSMANCITLVRMVMAPTATSPPYFKSEELKQTAITLSVDCMIKVAAPNATQGRMIPGFRFRFFRRSRRIVVLPIRKLSTHTQEAAWDRMVASAAPRTPILRAKMKMGSRMILHTAPISTLNIPCLAKPWAVIKAFMPSVSWTKMVPRA